MKRTFTQVFTVALGMAAAAFSLSAAPLVMQGPYSALPCKAESSRFVSRPDLGGCYDTQTRLVWSANTLDPDRTRAIYNYNQAKQYAADLLEGGDGVTNVQDDWRLPTLTEMRVVAGPLAWTHLNIFRFESEGVIVQFDS